MRKCFSFGLYNCLINGDAKLIGLIPDSWEKYTLQQDAALQTITLKLEEEQLECEDTEHDGWLSQERQGFSMTVFVENKKPIFALQYREPHTVTISFRKALDSYIRIGIHYGLMLALHRQCVGLHGVTLLCGNEIIILSAPSGTGKTTLAKLLEKHCDAVMINGDFALLSLTEDGVIYEPTPFCGTSRRSLNHRFRVNRIVFLGQAKENIWRRLNGREAMIRFMSNAFVPDWDSSLQQAVNENIMKCISLLRVNAYDFAPVKEAAEEFLKRVEEDSSL